MDTSANPDLKGSKSLAALLTEQKVELLSREAAVEEYKGTQIHENLWQGFWCMYRPRVGGYRDMFIQQIAPGWSSNSSSTTAQEHTVAAEGLSTAAATAMSSGRAGGTLHGIWREGGITYIMKGTLSPSQRMVEGATVHQLVPSASNPTTVSGLAATYQHKLLEEENTKQFTALDKKFAFPMSLKIGTGHQSIRANFDWRFLHSGGTDHCILSRQHPSVVVLYTTDSGVAVPVTVNDNASAAAGDRSDLPSLAGSSILGASKSGAKVSSVGSPRIAPHEEEDGLTLEDINEMGEVRTRKILRSLLAPVQSIASSVAALDADNFAVAPVTSSSEINTNAHRVVLKSQIKRWLEVEDLALHWCEGGLYSNDEYACITKDDIEKTCFEENKFCLIPATIRGVAQIRQQKLHALLVHVEILPPSSSPNQVTPAQQASEDKTQLVADEAQSTRNEDRHRSVSIVEVPTLTNSDEEERLVAEIESEAPGVSSGVGLIDEFLLPPQLVDGYLTLQGTFSSVEKASAALHTYLVRNKPQLPS